MKKLFFVVAVATLFFSCQKEIEPTTPTETKGFTFTAGIENLATKADINGDNELVWTKGDKIGIYVNDPTWGSGDDQSGMNQPFTLVGNGNTTTGKFKWDYDEGNFTSELATVAYFPLQTADTDHPEINNVYNGIAYFKMRGDYYNYTSGQMLTPLVATMAYDSEAKDYLPIDFKHAGAAIKVTIENLPVGVHSIGMTVDGQQVYGSYKINPANAGTDALSLDGAADSNKNTIWLNIEPTDAEDAFTFLFPVPALAKPKLSFQMYDENDVLVWSKNLKAQTSDLGRGAVLAMPELEITPYEKFTEMSSFGVRGKVNGAQDANWDSTVIAMFTDGKSSVVKGVELKNGDEIKVTDGTTWPAGDNWSITKDGYYDIIYNHDKNTMKVVETGRCPYPDSLFPHRSGIKNATNLGATETANCYVITAPGNYKIPARKGNSSESAGTVAGVQLLWETYNNDQTVTANSVIAAVDWDAVDNCVYFKTPSTLKPGNALIAAKDAEGNIIWSWHIWIPETAIATSTYGNIYNHELMDRNLGALVAATTSNVPVESYGLNYQWGRKDPFVGAKRIDSSSNALISGTEMTVAGDHMTVAETIANPTVFAVYSSSDTWGPWLNPASDTPTLWTNDSKTIYDPCPAGYRVPARDDSQPLHSSDLSTVTGWSDNSDGHYFTLGNPVAVFPFCGYLNEAGAREYSGKRSFIWTAYANSSNDGYFMNVRTGSDHGRTSTKTSRGGTVRCVKIEDAPLFSATEKANAVDKSVDESANCYVVVAESSNASKVFKFRTVKGNSSESVGSAASASVIWETWNNASAVTAKSVIDAVEYDEGYVYFRMPASPLAGNALIAVEDSNGTILWSWHIWVPSTSVATIDNGIHTTAMMDRNLGALNVTVASADAKIDVTSMGMWYQWGRKDPFPGPNNIETEGTYPGFASVSGTAPSAQKVQLTLEQSIQQPTLFARGLYVDDTLTVNDWLSTPDGTLWGDNTSKSKYDPCPAGYRVPNRDLAKPLWKADMTNETGWSYNATNYWFTLGDPASVFPCAGYCDGGTAKVTFRTVLWNAHQDSAGNADTAYNIYVYINSGNPQFATYGHGKNRGYYVRCCVE